MIHDLKAWSILIIAIFDQNVSVCCLFFTCLVRLPSHFAERIHRKKTTIETNEYFCVFVLRTVNMWHARHKKMEKKKIALALGVMNSKPAYYSIVDRFGICFDLNTPPHHKFYFQMSNSSFFAILPIRYRIFFCSHFALVRFGFSIGVFQINAFRIRNFSHFFFTEYFCFAAAAHVCQL